MSECVVRMEMPGSCLSCPFFNKVGCKASNRMFPDWMNVAARPRDCPIICQLPEGHGRLGDLDELADDMKARKAFFGRKSDPQCLVEDAPTIVPVERSETCLD